MLSNQEELSYFRARAEREIALAQATGAKAHASADFRTVYIERRDGTKDVVHVPPPVGQQH